MMSENFVRFQWLRLPRFVRAVLIGVGLASILCGGIGTVILAVVIVLHVAYSLLGEGGAIVFGIFVFISGVSIFIVWDDIQPAIKRKAKE